MYTYIIIDDERLIRLGLISKIEEISSEKFECIGEAENGKTRKYYAILPKGLEQLEKEKAQWNKFSTSVNKVIGVGSYVFS